MKQPKMSMSLDRLFFFWRKGDSLLIEKREQDLFERMKNFWHKYGILLCWKGGCAYDTVTGRSMGRDFRVYGG